MATNDGRGVGRSGEQRQQAPSSAGSKGPGAASKRDGETVPNRGATVEPPEHFGRYRIKKKLGGGGMGAVYLAHDTELDREVALKVPHFSDDDPEVRERFLREARSAAKLDHPNLCPVFDVGVFDGVYYLTMRYLKGNLLSEYAGTPQPPRKVVEVIAELAQALEAAHRKDVIHRDLKPDNVMMCGSVGPTVMDFGLAKQTKQQDHMLTQAGTMMGTPAYMPPEQMQGKLELIGPQSDIYTLGVIFFQLLTGRLPFEGTTAEVCGKILYTEAPRPSQVRPDLNAKLDAICGKAMAKAPEQRYATMKLFAAALLDYLKTTPAAEGAGSLIPNPPTAGAGNRSGILAAQTVAPVAGAGNRADVFGAATMAPGRGLAPLLPQGGSGRIPPMPTQMGGKAPSSVRKPPAATGKIHSREEEDEERSGVSVGAVLGWIACVMLMLGGLGGLGFLAYTLKSKKTDVASVGPGDNKDSDKANGSVGKSDGNKASGKANDRETPKAPPTPPVVIRETEKPKPEETPNVPFIRPIVVQDEKPKPLPVERVRPLDEEKSWVQLFDGKTLNGWKVGPRSAGRWRVAGGALTCSGPASYLFSERGDYENFHFRVEARINLRGNSGQFFRAEFGPAPLRGYEAQIALPGGDPRYWTGSLYNIVPIKERLHDANEWFTQEVIANGDHIIIKVNDKKVVDIHDGRYRKGYFALQHNNPQTVVQFRRVEVKEGVVKTPEVKTPEVKTPEVKTPEVKTPEVKTPEVKTPVVKTPDKAPEVVKNDDPLEQLRKGQDFTTVTAGTLPRGWKGKTLTMCVQKNGVKSGLVLMNGAIGAVILPPVRLNSGFIMETELSMPDFTSGVMIRFDVTPTRYLLIEVSGLGNLLVQSKILVNAARVWRRNGQINKLILERGKDAFTIKMNGFEVSSLPVKVASGTFTVARMGLTINPKTFRAQSPWIHSVRLGPSTPGE